MSKKLDGLKIAQEIAKERGGRCLSYEYKNNKQKLLWECKEEHRWNATLYDVKCKNSWCPKCAKIKQSNQQRLQNGLLLAQQIAESHGGKCLSTEYINNSTKMLFECKIKHRWWSRLNDIKDGGYWCRRCGILEGIKKSNHSYVLYHWKTGEELICQASYEKAVVEYFNANKINFRWQSKTFTLPDGKHTYRPDLYLFSTKKWIEVKGYFRKDAEEKWNWFHKEHPNSELWDKTKLKQMGIL